MPRIGRIKFMLTFTGLVLLTFLALDVQDRPWHLNDTCNLEKRNQENREEPGEERKSVKINNTLPRDDVSAFPPTLINGTDINPAINEFFTIKDHEKKDTYINLHQYTLLLNTRMCFNRKLFLLIVVHSAPYNIAKRTNIRSTYGSVQSHRGRQLGVVFILGSVYSPKLQESLDRESQTFGDIVQGNFHDSYRNLSTKHIMGMHWYLHHCSSQFILKLDDDTFINPFRVVDSLENETSDAMVLHCHILRGEVPVRTKSKWQTSVEQYPFPMFPPFCLGFAYITTPRAWEALYRASGDRHMMEMDDVFVSVVLSLKANVAKVDLKNLVTCSRGSLLGNIETFAFVLDRASVCKDKPFHMWKLLLKRLLFR